MSQFEYLLSGTYFAIFSAPILSLIFLTRFTSLNNFLVISTASMVAVGFIAIRLGFTFKGIFVDAACLFIGYVLACISALKLATYRNVILISVGVCLFLPACGIALLSIPAFVGVLFAVGEFETEYESIDAEGVGCRISSFGNATTSTGGYNASIFNVFWLFEKEINYITVDTTRQAEVTPEHLCEVELSKIKTDE